MIKKGDFIYDFGEDIYYVKALNRNYVSSFDNRNFIFDLDDKNEICGIEILDVSKVFGISKFDLKNIVANKVEVIVDGDVIKIRVDLELRVRNKDKGHSYVYDMINSENLPSIKASFSLG